MTFSGPVINQSACGIYLSHIIRRKYLLFTSLFLVHFDIKLTFQLKNNIVGLGRVILKTGVYLSK